MTQYKTKTLFNNEILRVVAQYELLSYGYTNEPVDYYVSIAKSEQLEFCFTGDYNLDIDVERKSYLKDVEAIKELGLPKNTETYALSALQSFHTQQLIQIYQYDN